MRDALTDNGKVAAYRVETRWTGETRQNMPLGNEVASESTGLSTSPFIDATQQTLRSSVNRPPPGDPSPSAQDDNENNS